MHLRSRINLPEFSINHLRINYQNWHHDLGLGWQIGEIFLIAEILGVLTHTNTEDQDWEHNETLVVWF